MNLGIAGNQRPWHNTAPRSPPGPSATHSRDSFTLSSSLSSGFWSSVYSAGLGALQHARHRVFAVFFSPYGVGLGCIGDEMGDLYDLSNENLSLGGERGRALEQRSANPMPRDEVTAQRFINQRRG
ncbi:hypothetical protein U1Q18_051085 [Sarracenia purpurea var. burkii]